MAACLEEVRGLKAAGDIDAYLAAAKGLAGVRPDDVAAQIEAAYACDRYGEEEDAIAFYDAAHRLGVPEAERSDFLVGYGSTLRNVGRTDDAIRVLGDLVAREPGNGAARAFLALARHSAGRYAEAVATLVDLALRFEEHDPSLARYARALRHYEGELTKAPAGGAPRVDAVLLRSEDPERLAGFYRDAFGYGAPRPHGPDHLGIPSVSNTYLGFDRVGPGEAGGRGVTEVWFRVPDCAAAYERALSLGARRRSAPDAECSPGETLARVLDPDGNTVGLIGP